MSTNAIVEICSTPLTTAPRRPDLAGCIGLSTRPDIDFEINIFFEYCDDKGKTVEIKFVLTIIHLINDTFE